MTGRSAYDGMGVDHAPDGAAIFPRTPMARLVTRPPPSAATISPCSRGEVNDVVPGVGRDHLGHNAPVTAGRVVLEAQQAGSGFAGQQLRLAEISLSPIGRHMLAEYPLHDLGMARAHRVAPGFWRAEALQGDIGNALF